MRRNRGLLLVLSGPSGAGKGTLRHRLFEELPDLGYSISCTTRSPRPGEADGVDYRFISPAEFQQRVEAGQFLEWAHVHGHSYGTLVSDVEEALTRGVDLFLEIDVQGALQVKKKMAEAVTVFVAPPSMEVLEQRLRQRGTESKGSLALRLQNARGEMEFQKDYDFVIVNDDLDRAATELRRIVEGLRQRASAPGGA